MHSSAYTKFPGQETIQTRHPMIPTARKINNMGWKQELLSAPYTPRGGDHIKRHILNLVSDSWSLNTDMSPSRVDTCQALSSDRGNGVDSSLRKVGSPADPQCNGSSGEQ